MLTLGIDSGSTSTKAALFDGSSVVEKRIVPTGVRPAESLRSLYEELHSAEVAYTVTTGYGRALLPEADKSITEITCHGAGAAFLCPDTDTVIDVGGQDSKVILLDPAGTVADFLMNDKCAAGTGRFLEMACSRAGTDIEHLDDFVAGATPVNINAMCAVFAESEIVGLLAQDIEPADIVLGCVHSICRRTAIFSQRLSKPQPSVFFSGGLSRSRAVCSALESQLDARTFQTHELAQYNGAVGAAVLGWRRACR